MTGLPLLTEEQAAELTVTEMKEMIHQIGTNWSTMKVIANELAKRLLERDPELEVPTAA